MSGIAEILHHLGYRVQGSDIADSANCKRLREKGIAIFIGHKPENLGDAAVLVTSSAVRADNPEVMTARERMIPIVRRAEMLGELMRLKWSIAVAGTHGKTTTTSLIAAILDAAGLDPTVINGGIINQYGTNARLGAGDWLVAEADESDGSFVKLPATVVVVTNMDPEHLDFYGTVTAMNKAYENFIENIPFYGFATLCIDHPVVQSMIPIVADRRVVTYGLSPQADVRASNIHTQAKGISFDVAFTDRTQGVNTEITAIRLPMFGIHNVQNALAAIAIANEMGVNGEAIRRGLTQFGGVKRRFTHVGTVNGITIIDDYGHHPVEIAAVLKAARSASAGRVIAVMQPHRYTRLRDLMEEFCTAFNDADHIFIAPVYAAGEAPIPGIDSEALIAGLRRHGIRNVEALPAPERLPEMIQSVVKSGDMVVCLGAGNITQWAHALPSDLAKRYGVAVEVAE